MIPKDVDMVVYTPAVPKDHKELVFYQQNGYRVVKRSDVLQMITKVLLISVLPARMEKQLHHYDRSFAERQWVWL
jgi:hypothetical protein